MSWSRMTRAWIVTVGFVVGCQEVPIGSVTDASDAAAESTATDVTDLVDTTHVADVRDGGDLLDTSDASDTACAQRPDATGGPPCEVPEYGLCPSGANCGGSTACGLGSGCLCLDGTRMFCTCTGLQSGCGGCVLPNGAACAGGTICSLPPALGDSGWSCRCDVDGTVVCTPESGDASDVRDAIDVASDAADAFDAVDDGSDVDAVDAPVSDAVFDATDMVHGADASGCGDCVPRAIAPLSTSTVTSLRPTLRWQLAAGSDGAHVQICADRACTTIETEADALGASIAPNVDLAPGAHFWRLFGVVGGVTGATPSATWEFFVHHGIGAGDTSWGTIADFDGDGRGDLVVDDGRPFTGDHPLYEYLGTASGLPSAPNTVLTSQDASESSFGYPMADLGDVNGDGFADFGLHACADTTSPASRIDVFFGGPGGLGNAQSVVVPQPDAPYCGGMLWPVGDVNGDGYADVAAPVASSVEFTSGVGIYFGSASGLVSPAAVVIIGGNEWTGFGGTVRAADVNGDGFVDLAITEIASGHLFNDSMVHLYFGSASGLPSSPTVTVDDAAMPNVCFAEDIALADVNGDGFADLVAGETSDCGTSRSLFVFDGTRSGLQTTPIVSAAPSGESIGAIRAAGDVNGDGIDDIVAVSVPTSGVPATARMFWGSASGVTYALSDAFHIGAANAVTLTPTVGRDVDGDGLADVILGGANTTDSSATTVDGAVYIVPGSNVSFDPTAASVLLCPNAPDTEYGALLACRSSKSGTGGVSPARERAGNGRETARCAAPLRTFGCH